MSEDQKLKSAKAVFVKFADVPEGVQVVASSDAGVRRMKPTIFKDYDTGCQTLATRLGSRAHPPSSLVCELVH